ncbi:MAG: hypothetical protein AB7O66_25660, partial [Limisphaerales bacterium]
MDCTSDDSTSRGAMLRNRSSHEGDSGSITGSNCAFSGCPSNAGYSCSRSGIGKRRWAVVVAVWLALGLTGVGDTNRIVVIDGTERNAGFGNFIVTLGDVNRDGLADFALAEP